MTGSGESKGRETHCGGGLTDQRGRCAEASETVRGQGSGDGEGLSCFPSSGGDESPCPCVTCLQLAAIEEADNLRDATLINVYAAFVEMLDNQLRAEDSEGLARDAWVEAALGSLRCGQVDGRGFSVHMCMGAKGACSLYALVLGGREQLGSRNNCPSCQMWVLRVGEV